MHSNLDAFRGRRLAAALLAVVLCISWIARSAPPAPTKPTTAAIVDDAVAIKDAAKLMYIWGTVPNYVAPDDVAYGTDDESRKWLAAQSEYARSEHRLADVVRLRLGEQPLAALHLEFPSIAEAQVRLAKAGDRFLMMVDAARVEVHGDSADLTMPRTQFDDVLHARKIDGKWKFPISAELVRSKYGLVPNALELTTQAALKEAALDDLLAADLTAARLKSAKEVEAAKAEGKKEIYPPQPATRPQ
jgi:hypothetical protein